uniref:C-type lectin domain-containing protein n=1 Tax=Astyanax mexicanus TaxID=7994 RepID=A0A8B9JFF6_ASTMX
RYLHYLILSLINICIIVLIILIILFMLGQRICRRGTERPCYKIFHHHDSRFKVSFEEARKTCREEDDGELLSIETENEQRLMENFIQGLRAADGDFWIGLRRSRGSGTGDCSAQYYWLDYSQTSFRYDSSF